MTKKRSLNKRPHSAPAADCVGPYGQLISVPAPVETKRARTPVRTAQQSAQWALNQKITLNIDEAQKTVTLREAIIKQYASIAIGNPRVRDFLLRHAFVDQDWISPEQLEDLRRIKRVYGENRKGPQMTPAQRAREREKSDLMGEIVQRRHDGYETDWEKYHAGIPQTAERASVSKGQKRKPKRAAAKKI